MYSGIYSRIQILEFFFPVATRVSGPSHFFRWCSYDYRWVLKMRYPTFLSLRKSSSLFKWRGGVYSVWTNSEENVHVFLKSHAFHLKKKNAEIPAFLTLKTSSTPAFPAPGEAPLSQCKRGYLFLAWPIPKSYGYPIRSPSYKLRLCLVKSLNLPRNHGTRFRGCMTWGPILFCPKLQSHKWGRFYVQTHLCGWLCKPLMIDASLSYWPPATRDYHRGHWAPIENRGTSLFTGGILRAG